MTNRPIIFRGREIVSPKDVDSFLMAKSGEKNGASQRFTFDSMPNGVDISAWTVQLHVEGDFVPSPGSNIITTSTGLTKTTETGRLHVDWLISDETTYTSGTGTAQFKFISNTGAIWRSDVFSLEVEASVDGDETVITLYPDVLEDHEARITDLEQSFSDAVEEFEEDVATALAPVAAAVSSANSAASAANTAANNAAGTINEAVGAANEAVTLVNEEIAASTELRNALADYDSKINHFKGWYISESALRSAHPSGEAGDQAIVAKVDAPDTTWNWDVDANDWIDTNQAVLEISVADIAERDSLTVPLGTEVFVEDATDDETVTTGWAKYRRVLVGGTSQIDPESVLTATKNGGEEVREFTHSRTVDVGYMEFKDPHGEGWTGDNHISIWFKPWGAAYRGKTSLSWSVYGYNNKSAGLGTLNIDEEDESITLTVYDETDNLYNGTWVITGFDYISEFPAWEKVGSYDSVNEKQYSLIYNYVGANGGNSDESKSVQFGYEFGTLPTPTRTGYDFLGWFTAPVNGTEITAESIVNDFDTDGEINIYAHWQLSYTTGLSYTYVADDGGYYIVGGGAETAGLVNIPPTYDDGTHGVKTVKEIVASGFLNNTAITQVIMPSSITRIASRAFEGCTNLIAPTLPLALTAIEAQTFMFCSSITSIYLHSGITSIGSEAFSYTGLTAINIPATVTTIDWRAFRASSSLAAVVVNRFTAPSTITALGDVDVFAFANASLSIVVPYGSGNIYKAATRWSTYADVISEAAPVEVTITNLTIGDYLEIPSGVTDNIVTIGADDKPKDSGKGFSATAVAGKVPYYGTNGVLKAGAAEASGDVVIKSQLDTLKSDSEDYTDEAVAAATIPTSSAIFLWQPDQTIIKFRASKETTYAAWDSGTTYNTDDLKSYDGIVYKALRETTGDQPDESASDWSAQDLGERLHWQKGASNKTVYVNLGNGTSTKTITIPSGSGQYISYYYFDTARDYYVTIIGDCYGACVNNDSHVDVLYVGNPQAREKYIEIYAGSNFPIGNYSFFGCDNLSKAEFSQNWAFTSIGISAFYDGNLTVVKIPDSVTSIGANAFRSNTSLKSADINYGITTIGNDAFSATAIEKLIVPSTITSIGTDAFSGCVKLNVVVFRGATLPTFVSGGTAGIFASCRISDIIATSSENADAIATAIGALNLLTNYRKLY